MTTQEKQQVVLKFLEGFTGTEISSRELRKVAGLVEESRAPWKRILAFILDGTHGWMLKKATLYRIADAEETTHAIEKAQRRQEKHLTYTRQYVRSQSYKDKKNQRRREQRKAEGAGSTASERMSMLKYQWNKQGIVGMDHYQWNTLADLQGFTCAICRSVVEDKAGKGKTLCVDHDHATGRIRELLCGPCNIGLGGFRDRTDLLDAAKAYLLKHQSTAGV